MSDRKSPVIFDIDDAAGDPAAAPPSPAEAAPVPDLGSPEMPDGRAMQQVARLAARRPSRLGRAFWVLLTALAGAFVSLAAWNAITALIAQTPWLGWTMTGLLALFGLVCLGIVVREAAGFARLARIDGLHRDAEAALAVDGDLTIARDVTNRLTRLYARRDETRWGRDRFAARAAEQMDADALLGLAEQEILAPLDAAARAEVEAAARQVATVTALVPLAFADVIAALTANMRMVRRVAEVYGGRAGGLASWRLMRAVLTHLVATGAVAVGDDMLGSVAGGNVLARLSRRFGEGLVNGALTARVGVAAMEVCRPLPFRREKRPSVTRLVTRSVTGLFDREDTSATPPPP